MLLLLPLKIISFVYFYLSVKILKIIRYGQQNKDSYCFPIIEGARPY